MMKVVSVKVVSVVSEQFAFRVVLQRGTASESLRWVSTLSLLLAASDQSPMDTVFKPFILLFLPYLYIKIYLKIITLIVYSVTLKENTFFKMRLLLSSIFWTVKFKCIFTSTFLYPNLFLFSSVFVIFSFLCISSLDNSGGMELFISLSSNHAFIFYFMNLHFLLYFYFYYQRLK